MFTHFPSASLTVCSKAIVLHSEPDQTIREIDLILIHRLIEEVDLSSHISSASQYISILLLFLQYNIFFSISPNPSLKSSPRDVGELLNTLVKFTKTDIKLCYGSNSQ